MKSKWLVFVLGCLVGAVLSMVLNRESESYADFPEPDDAELDSLKTKIAQLEEALDLAESNSSQVSSSTESVSLASASQQVPNLQRLEIKTPASVNSSSVFMAQGFQEQMKRQVERQVSMYRRRLGLTDEQAQAFEDLLTLRFQRIQDRVENLRNGSGDFTINDDAHITEQDLVDLAAEILSDEQLAEFNAIKEEEINSRNEMMATAQLSQMAPMLGLDSDQKDALFSLFFNEASNFSGGAIDQDQLKQARAFTNQEAEKFLTPSQLEQFLEMREGQGHGVSVFFGR